MVRLRVLTGRRAGVCLSGSRFPIKVGRSTDNHLALDEPGVWPSHFSIRREKNDFVIQVGTDASISINGEAAQTVVLRNGDIISLGAVKLEFGLEAVRQTSLVWRERLTWGALGALALGEVAIAYTLW